MITFKYNNIEYELIQLCLTGSRLYGNSRPDSDYDYRGVFISPLESKIGLFNSVEQINSKEIYSILKKEFENRGIDTSKFIETDDIVLYEIRNFFKLAADNNPNIIDILYAPNEALIHNSGKWNKIIQNGNLFLSKKIKFTFSGYAFSQLQRLKGHNKWINKYPEIGIVYNNIKEAWQKGLIDFDYLRNKFTGSLAISLSNEFGHKRARSTYYSFENSNLYPTDTYIRPHVINFCTLRDIRTNKSVEITEEIRTNLFKFSTFEKISDNVYRIYFGRMFDGIFSIEGNIRSNGINEDFSKLECLYTLHVDYENYKAAVKEYEQMWEWKINRNKERGKIEDKVGYDTKHASHLIRLLLKANQILKFSDYNPVLSEPEKDIINSIKSGVITYEDMIILADSLQESLDKNYETSELQKEPKRKEINKLLIELSL